MRTLFILGAGASRQGGGPLMADFLDRADAIQRSRDGVQGDVSQAFSDVFKLLSELRAMYAKAHLDLENIEVLFGLVEMAGLVGRIGSYDANAIKAVRDSLVTVIVKTLEYTLKFPVSASGVHPPPPYDSFLDVLLEAEGHDLSIISLNYDVCIDYGLRRRGKAFTYGLDGVASARGIRLLKLHGSLNWGICDKCGAVGAFDLAKLSWDLFRTEPSVVCNASDHLSGTRHCEGGALLSGALIVPPIMSKASYYSGLASVWRHAATAFASAENIVVIGYSLPQTDDFFRFLYAIGSDSPTRLKNFIVCDPDQDGSVERRFREFLGWPIESRRFRFERATFDKALPIIHALLHEK